MDGDFFFSSRRRHTRYIGDWSSDVCSSDLIGVRHRPEERRPDPEEIDQAPRQHAIERSEERRVGKECKVWWSPDHLKTRCLTNDFLNVSKNFRITWLYITETSLQYTGAKCT